MVLTLLLYASSCALSSSSVGVVLSDRPPLPRPLPLPRPPPRPREKLPPPPPPPPRPRVPKRGANLEGGKNKLSWHVCDAFYLARYTSKWLSLQRKTFFPIKDNHLPYMLLHNSLFCSTDHRQDISNDMKSKCSNDPYSPYLQDFTALFFV